VKGTHLAMADVCPPIDLRDTVPKMIAALKADPVAWYRENKLEPSSGASAG